MDGISVKKVQCKKGKPKAFWTKNQNVKQVDGVAMNDEKHVIHVSA
jgi:hypothetical protein